MTKSEEYWYNDAKYQFQKRCENSYVIGALQAHLMMKGMEKEEVDAIIEKARIKHQELEAELKA